MLLASVPPEKLIVGYVLSKVIFLVSVLFSLLALSTNWGHVLGVRFADRVGKGIRTSPRDALIAASVDKKIRGKFFGFHRAMDTSGAILGTIIAAVLIGIFTTELNKVFEHIKWLKK